MENDQKIQTFKNKHDVIIQMRASDERLTLPTTREPTQIEFKDKNGRKEILSLENNNDLHIKWVLKEDADETQWTKGQKVNGWFTLSPVSHNQKYLTGERKTKQPFTLKGM